MRLVGLGLVLTLIIWSQGAAFSAEGRLDGFHPSVGAPGDLVYVQGAHLDAEAGVRLGGRPAKVLRATRQTLLFRVPRDASPGAARLSVGAVDAPGHFTILRARQPLIHGASASVATPGQTLLVHGRRLDRGSLDFADEQGLVVARVPAAGGPRVMAVEVPRALPEGHYRLLCSTQGGSESLMFAPCIEVVSGGPRHFDAVRRQRICAGQPLTLFGTNLSPTGSCEIRWTNEEGQRTRAAGWSNGYDRIFAVVPAGLVAGGWYMQAVVWPEGHKRAIGRVQVRPCKAPRVMHLDTATASPGGSVGLQGMPSTGLGGPPSVVLTQGEVRVGTRTLYLHPGGLGHGRAWVVSLPESMDAGDYRVTVEGRGWRVDAGSLRVGQHERLAATLR